MLRTICVVLVLVLAAPAGAATYTVNDIGDDPDGNIGDGVCDIAAGGPNRCTLRAAIEEANANAPGFDTITFSLGLITISPASALPTITDHTQIDARTAPGFASTATSTLDAPPSVYLNGSGIGGSTADGLRTFGDWSVLIHGLGITNFPDNGIEINGAEPAIVDGNWIGVGRTGGIAGNGGTGVYLNNCARCVIGQEFSDGGAIEGLGNVIGNNGEDGIYTLLGSDMIIGGNHIGVDPVNSADLGNARHGIHLLGPGSAVGQFRGLTADTWLTTPNYITNNNGDGIRTGTGGHRIYTNQVFGNSGNGVVLNGGSSFLGYVNEQMRNYIRGNGGHGLVIGDAFASPGNTVQYNWIHQNAQRGVQLSAGDNNLLRYNQIFDNTGDAVRIDAAGNTLTDNSLGLLFDILAGNGANGVVINAGNNIVHENRIAAMADDGIDVVSGAGSTITSNLVGTDGAGADQGNTNVGIRVRNGATGTLLSGNEIGFNFDGVRLEGSGTAVCENLVGVTASNVHIGNASEGIRIVGGGNTVGNAGGGCAGNYIGFNGSDGVEITGDANIIRDNTIGGAPFVNLGNGQGGILLSTGADLNDISGNVIHNNTDAGVRVGALAGTRNRIERNNFRNNGGLAIDLLVDGVTPNDAGDADTGPNNLQNYPVFEAVIGGASEVTISYHVDSGLAVSNYPLQVDFYLSPTDDREGYRVHTDTYSVSPGVTRTISFDPVHSFAWLTAMVIDVEGNSSELANPVSYTLVAPPSEIFADGFETP